MIREIRNVRFLKRLGINGIVLYPFILYASKTPGERLRRHEMVHVAQIRRKGVIGFYLLYLFEYLLLRRRGLSHDAAYRGISFEKEAYELEAGPKNLIG